MNSEKSKKVDWTEEAVKRFWDYQATNSPEEFFTHKFGSKICRNISCYLEKCQTILDYGCGAGSMIDHFLKLGLKTSGLDLSEKNIELVAQKYRNHKNFAGIYSIDELKTIHQKFDSLACFEVLEHLEDDHLKNTFNNFKKLLNEDGVLIVTTPNDEDLEKSQIYCPNCNCLFHKWQHLRSWDMNSLPSFLQQHGFLIEAIYATDFSSSLKHKCFRFAHSLINKPREFFVKIPPHLVCVARLKTASKA